MWVPKGKVNKEYRNTDFNTITDNEALVIDVDLSNNRSTILVIIYCPNGNPKLRLFEAINNLSNNIMFIGDFNSKSESFGCEKKTTLACSMVKDIKSHLNLIFFCLYTPYSKFVTQDTFTLFIPVIGKPWTLAPPQPTMCRQLYSNKNEFVGRLNAVLPITHHLVVDVLIQRIHESPWPTDHQKSQPLTMFRQILHR